MAKWLRHESKAGAWIILSLLAGPLSVDAADSSGRITIAWPGRIKDVPVARGNSGEAVFAGVNPVGEPGTPALPRQTIEVLLPPTALPRSVTVTIEGATVEDVPGQWEVAPAPPVGVSAAPGGPIWSPGRHIVNGRDVDAYGKNAFVRDSFVGRTVAGQLREWRLVEIEIFPYRYNPVTKRLQRLKTARIVVRFNRQSSGRRDITRARTLASSARQDVRGRVVNFDEVSASYDVSPSEEGASTPVGYAIVTTAAIRGASTQLGNFIAAKQARGFTVTVATESDWGGGTGNTAANNIRSWLASHYQALDLGYVLLIGNPNPSSGDVPMKMTYPQDEDPMYPDCPTDYCYAELTGDWDLDDDGLYGEYDDDYGSGGAERNCEVIVGRIPYYGVINDLDAILAKIMAYESTPAEDAQWRKKALLPIEPSDASTPGYQLGEAIKNAALIPAGDWTWHRVYEQTYGLSPSPETTPCSEATVTAAWTNSDIGAVFWWTHGDQTSAVDIMDLSHAALLDNDHPSFTFQCSCLNSYPEAANNLAYSLLKNGGISTISGTRVTWYFIGQTSFAGRSSNSSMTYEYARRMVNNQMCAGDALQDLKADIAPEVEVMWMNYVDFNIYGDPSIGLYTVAVTPLDGLEIAPPEGLITSGYEGGPFGPSNKVYTVTNGGASNLAWVAECPSNWVSVAPASGVLAAGQTNGVTVSIGAGADSLGVGNYSATATFSNATSGVVQVRPITLTVWGTNLTLILPGIVSEGQGTLANVGRVAISGALGADLVVALASGDTTELSVPASVTIPAGQTNAAFSVTVEDDAETDGTQLAGVTASAAGFADSDATVSVLDNDLHHFAWGAISGPKDAGTAFGVTLIAQDVNNVTMSNYPGPAYLSGAGDGGAVVVTPASAGTFSNGRWVGSMAVQTPDTNVRLSADDGAGHVGTSTPFDVVVGPLDHFGWSSVAPTQYVGLAIPVAVEAKDAADNTVASFTDSVALSGWTGSSGAGQVVGFDDLTGAGTLVPAGYAGFSWSNFYYNNGIQQSNSGYYAGTVSPSNVVFNANADQASIVSTGQVNLISAYMTAAWNDNLQVQVNGYDGASLIYDNTYTLSATVPTLINFNYIGVTRVDFISYGGTPHPGYTGSGGHFAMDNITIGGAAASPVAIAPTSSGSFVGGVWTGSVTVLEVATNMYLRADDGGGHSGTGNVFSAVNVADLSVALPPDATEGDGVLLSTGQVFVSAAPADDLTVDLASGDPSEVTVPSSVIIPAGQTNAAFDVTIENDADLDGPQLATVTASALSYGS
ncbi:MAG TPA: C25 family peptidase propeptide domain-containing protein, partial [Verrucomicrobiae bacterium]|nr:C25 family peptidase propeptide domain-containing protein [Verrucomicrobiae bacterium]